MAKKSTTMKKTVVSAANTAGMKAKAGARSAASRLTLAAEDAVLRGARAAERAVHKRRTKRLLDKTGKVLKTVGKAVAVAAATAGAAVLVERTIRKRGAAKGRATASAGK